MLRQCTSRSGQTLSIEDLAKQETSDTFGDIAGVGPGCNWGHVNSVDFDPNDDLIVIFWLNRSPVIKIGDDKKVKDANGRKNQFTDKVLTSVGKDDKPLHCEDNHCDGGFDRIETQHTGWIIDSKTNNRQRRRASARATPNAGHEVRAHGGLEEVAA